jgi:hypothetical protein
LSTYSKFEPYLRIRTIFHNALISTFILHHHFPRRAMLNILKSLMP